MNKKTSMPNIYLKGNYEKIKFLCIILVVIVFIKMFMILYYHVIDNVGHELMEELEIADFEKLEGEDWYIVSKYTIDEEPFYDLSKINFEDNAVVISRGMVSIHYYCAFYCCGE